MVADFRDIRACISWRFTSRVGMCLIGVHLMVMCLMGVHLKGMCLMGVYLIGVYLTGVRLTGVRLTGVYLMTLFRGCTATGDIAGSCLQRCGQSASAPSLLVCQSGESGAGSRCRT